MNREFSVEMSEFRCRFCHRWWSQEAGTPAHCPLCTHERYEAKAREVIEIEREFYQRESKLYRKISALRGVITMQRDKLRRAS